MNSMQHWRSRLRDNSHFTPPPDAERRPIPLPAAKPKPRYLVVGDDVYLTPQQAIDYLFYAPQWKHYTTVFIDAKTRELRWLVHQTWYSASGWIVNLPTGGVGEFYKLSELE